MRVNRKEFQKSLDGCKEGEGRAYLYICLTFKPCFLIYSKQLKTSSYQNNTQYSMRMTGKKEKEKEATIKLIVNGEPVELVVGYQVEPWHTLVHTLRETLGLTGTKIGCNLGECGACTVIMDGKPILSCSTLTVECNGKEITTIEGLGDPIQGELHPLQKAFIEHDGLQCGFCTPGMIMQAKALLDKNPNPTEQQVKEGLSGNLCRCGSYVKIVESVLAAARSMRGD